jgi:hypothetical protein
MNDNEASFDVSFQRSWVIRGNVSHSIIIIYTVILFIIRVNFIGPAFTSKLFFDAQLTDHYVILILYFFILKSQPIYRIKEFG